MPYHTLVIGQIRDKHAADFRLHIRKNIFHSITPILNLDIEKAVNPKTNCLKCEYEVVKQTEVLFLQ